MQNLLNDVTQLLTEDERLVVDGKLLKNKVIELALNVDTSLIKLLLKHETIKQHFFTQIDDVLVFDKIKFQQFVSNKQFLADSYTAFKNKVGLTANSEYLTDSREVVLAWPYKDCVLEGGQDKDEAKRNEVFYNETLAPDQIDRLLSPKLLTNFKRYGKDDVHDLSSDSQQPIISTNDNLIIKGNNLLALHTLKKAYAGKVKLIYIDPPFNTGNDSFKYNDAFNHSTWLTFMRNRLRIAKDFLSNDGLIFINIDAIEEAYLKVLCDEIFGAEQFVNVLAVKSSTPSGTKTAHKNTTIIKQKDLILVYKKGGNLNLNPQYTKRVDWDTHYSLILEKNEAGQYVLSSLIDRLRDLKISSAKQKLDDLSVENSDFKDFYLENSSTICRLQSHKDVVAEKNSRRLKDEVYEHVVDGALKGLYYNGQVVTLLQQGIKRVYANQKFTDDLGMLLCDIWTDIDFQNTQNEGGVSFPTAKKPEALLSRIIELATNKNEIVMDYHLGSGTTCAVAHKMGRRFIGIEQLNYGENDSVKRLQNVINGEQSGVSRGYKWAGGGSFVYCELARANQTFIDDIQASTTPEQLQAIWKAMQARAFLSYQIEVKAFDANAADFAALRFEDQQRFLIEVLDKNMLYVPLSEMDDAVFGITDNDKALNKQFFGL